MNLHPGSQVSRSGTAMWTPVDREAVILARDCYLSLDPVGRRIWDLLEKPERIDALCSRLASEFGTEPARVEADLLPFLAELAAAGVLQVEADGRA